MHDDYQLGAKNPAETVQIIGAGRLGAGKRQD